MIGAVIQYQCEKLDGVDKLPPLQAVHRSRHVRLIEPLTELPR